MMRTFPPKNADSVCYFLSTHRQFRSIVQKIEFTTLWIILINAATFQQSMAPSILYTKLSFFTRATAYFIDFANATSKYKSVDLHDTIKLSLWLLLHHFGVLGIHLSSAFFLSPKAPIEVFVWALASQSSHNTWTKKFSLTLYWGNVLVGVLASTAYVWFLYDGGAQYGVLELYVASLVLTCFGITFLLGGSVTGSHFFVNL